ncbi:MAG: PEP-CTERM sorting domain-containing protein [Planctomycetes bacterium]|nr:PEP-CTERM sorting domain-containing protein [Planctomycetota bacterium]
MKKCLVLLMVLGIASMATAGLVVTGDAASFTIESDAAGVAGDTGQFTGFVGIQDGASVMTAFTWGAAAVVGADPVLYGYVPGTALGLPNGYDLANLTVTDGSPTSFLGIGDVLTFDVTGAVPYTVVVWDSAFTELASATIVPEPMTMGLLGLGGLFLRRRK